MWQLIINGPGYFDTTYDLPDGETFLGRADENDIVLSGDLVSRKHARIQVQGDALSAEDLGSRNGSRINGDPLTGLVGLKAGDTVTVGENTLSIRQPVKTESANTEMVDLGAGGIRRFGEGTDIGDQVVIAKNVRESVVLRALDNIEPFDTAPPPLTLDVSGVPPIAFESLLLLYKTAEALSRAKSLQAFLEETVDRVLQRVDATTAVVLLRHHSGVMVPAVVRHRGKLEQGEVPVSDAIISEALTKGAALLVGDVRDDRRFAQRDSVLLYGVDQVLCIPIGEKEPFGGVIYVNRKAGEQAALEQLLDLCTAVAHLIATGIEKFKTGDLSRGEDRIRQALERFHGPDIVERRIAEIGTSGDPLTSLEEKTVSVVFADIAGFSALIPGTAPDRLVEMLHEFYQRMTGILFSFEGTVDKFVGDAVMAVFGAPYSRGDDALRAVRAAFAMRAEWSRAMAAMTTVPPRELKIGIHTGRALAGTVGSEIRLDYTVLGEVVNQAAWLTSSGQPGQILITGKTLAAIGARFDVTPLGERPLGPHRDKVAVFEVLEEDTEGIFTHPGVQ